MCVLGTADVTWITYLILYPLSQQPQLDNLGDKLG